MPGHDDTRPVKPLDFDSDMPEQFNRLAGSPPPTPEIYDLVGTDLDGDISSSLDDLTQEMMILEDGANSPDEAGNALPNDYDLSIVDEEAIGAGRGLDEAELAVVDPIDGKPW